MSGNISYNTNIPFATNNPSNDQPLMEQNTNAINTWAGIDHVGFNVGGGFNSGQHLQVTFNSDNVPSLPTGNDPSGNKIGVLFTKTVGAGTINQLFYYAGSAAQSSTQYVSSANGSTFVLGGIIMKWGNVTATDNTTISFPVAFPNNCYNVQITVNATTVLPTLVTVSGAPIAGGFTPRVKDTNGTTTSPISIFYLAIGN
jgi:hypothetical protein